MTLKPTLRGKGPNAWAERVHSARLEYRSTQGLNQHPRVTWRRQCARPVL
jgi:hypothetical protein